MTVKEKSIWTVRIRAGKRIAALFFIAIAVVMLTVDLLAPGLLIELIRSHVGIANSGLALLYISTYFILAICVAVAIKGES